MDRKVSSSYRIFTFFAYILLTTIALSSILVFVHIFSVAFSSNGPANANLVSFWPKGITSIAIINALNDNLVGKTFFNSFLRLIIGVPINMLMIILVAFPLSKDNRKFPLRPIFMIIILITMLFHGGMVPNYLLIKQLNLNDTVWALVLPGAVQVFLCIVLLNFFRQLPNEIEEAAFIDGASYVKSLISIYLPLSAPSIATVGLFATINHWNAWFDGLIYMKQPSNYPYTTYLRILITRMDNAKSAEDMERLFNIGQRPMVMAYVLMSIVPIMCVYPFIQRYVKSGLVIGSVKG